MTVTFGRRELLATLGGAAGWPLAARAQQADDAGDRVSASTTANSLLTISPGREFTSNAWCHRRLAPDAALDPNSANIVQTLRNAVAPSGALYNNLAMPIWIVPLNQPTVAVALYTTDGARRVQVGEGAWSDQLISQLQAVPLPDGFFPGGGSDTPAAIYQRDNHQLWEGWAWAQTGLKVTNSVGALVDEWAIRWGGHWEDLRTSDGTGAPQPPSGIKPGISASGIPALAFTITLGDLKQQAINHPVGLTIPTGSARSDVWNNPPAWRCDGYPPQFDPNAIPEGAIFRLPANLDLNLYTATAWDGVSVKTLWRLVAEAMQNYGMVATDQGGGWIMPGEDQALYNYPIDTDPILSQVLGAYHPWGYDNQAVSQDTTAFPWDKLQLLQMNLVSA